MNNDDSYQRILEGLKSHSSLKQHIYRTTCEVFHHFKIQLKSLAEKMASDFADIDKSVEISYTDVNQFEAQIKFSGDVLIFTMHTNIFNFPFEHSLHKTSYVKADQTRAYCGVIHIHNFLSDSIKYNRINDMGYLIGRIFINKDRHFFVEGKGSLGFLYEDFSTLIIDDNYIDKIIKTAINYCFQFELLAPPFNEIEEVSLIEKQLEFANSGYQTGKLIGYKFNAQQQLEKTLADKNVKEKK